MQPLDQCSCCSFACATCAPSTHGGAPVSTQPQSTDLRQLRRQLHLQPLHVPRHRACHRRSPSNLPARGLAIQRGRLAAARRLRLQHLLRLLLLLLLLLLLRLLGAAQITH